MKPIYKLCDVCGDARLITRSIQTAQGPVPICYPCAYAFGNATLAAFDEGWDSEECERFGWLYVREMRGRRS